MATVVMNTEIITLDESDDELSTSGESSPNIFQPVPVIPPVNGFGQATATIVNEKPLDINAILGNLTTSKPKPPSVVPKVNVPNVLRPDPKLDVVLNKSHPVSLPIKRVSESPKIVPKKPKLISASKRYQPYANVTYLYSEPHSSHDHISDEFSGQYRCTALNCNKLLNNNVSFVYHLWAHVTTFIKRDFTKEMNLVTDEKFLRTCPECQAIFDHAYQKTKHYLEVHRQSTNPKGFCHICEITDDSGDHMARHRSNELPYECRKCRFKTSSREALMAHFSTTHIGSNYLICPFCSYTSTVQSEKNKPVVIAKNFISHMLNHGNIIARKCSSCCYKFMDTDKFESHSRNHIIEKHQFPVSSRTFESLRNRALKTKIRPEQLTKIKCVECSSLFLRVEDHFGEKRKCKRCGFESNCQMAYWRHRYLSPCNPDNAVRMKFYSDPRSPVKKPKMSKEAKKNLSVCRSKEFREVMSSDRNPLFSTEEQENIVPPPSAETRQVEAIEDFIYNMLTQKKYSQLPRIDQHRLVNYVSGNCMKEKSTEKFIK